ncbi:MAG: 50S ribosomal protein L15, large subunit ribosomal protein L15 [Candidatus Peregrinibacteria bacterium GW2011_GWF2_38_29]|nr:MAG: 50S ribosomal protein L15, large subunit ribosomal protein L15 [Candidatus Peregrinibacteria bacterium GW2011_GWF2_38_29]HBB02530.1 50S ribosomal protein L15 [Candidatus Peregrinibacteria bacterium]
MSLLNLSGNFKKKRKRVGRGNSSGHGNYSGRGMNGQNQRTGGGVRRGFEGGQTPLLRRMPKLSGFKSTSQTEYQIVNVDTLEKRFSDGDTVDIISLSEKNITRRKSMPVKLLGKGELKKKLTVKVDKISKSAEEKIKKAGGTVEIFVKK